MAVLGREGGCCSCYVGRHDWSDQLERLPASHTSTPQRHVQRHPYSQAASLLRAPCDQLPLLNHASNPILCLLRLTRDVFVFASSMCVRRALHLVVVYKCSRSLVVPTSVAASARRQAPTTWFVWGLWVGTIKRVSASSGVRLKARHSCAARKVPAWQTRTRCQLGASEFVCRQGQQESLGQLDTY